MDWVVALFVLAALGAGSLVAGGALVMNAAVALSRRSRSPNPAEAFLRSSDGRADVFTEDDLYGLRGVPWTLWSIAGTLTGVVMAYLLLGERNAALAPVGLVGALAPPLVRAYLVRRRRARINRHVRAFTSLLRRTLSLGAGLHPALQDTVGLLERGVVCKRLRHHLGRPSIVDPVDVVRDLARDIRSVELDSLVVGIEAARRGRVGWSETILWYPWVTTARLIGRTLTVDPLLDQARSPVGHPCLMLRGRDGHHPVAGRPALPLILQRSCRIR